jgi:hypothetical protein
MKCYKCKKERDINYMVKNSAKKSGFSGCCKRCKQLMNIYEETNLSTFMKKRIYQRMYRHLKYTANVDPRLSLTLLGCTMDELIRHLEKQFKPEMSWSNFGDYWVCDHRLPIASFNLKNHGDLPALLHHTNLQPLAKEDHRQKTNAERKVFRKVKI